MGIMKLWDIVPGSYISNMMIFCGERHYSIVGGSRPSVFPYLEL